MKPAEWAAWVGAVTGLASLCWNIYSKMSAGPKLRVTAYADMVQRPAPLGDPRFLRITVQNIGTEATTLTNCTLVSRASRWQRLLQWARVNEPLPEKHAVLNSYQGEQLPQATAPGSQWTALMQQDADFGLWLDSGQLYCAIWHSFSQKPVAAKIIRTASPPSNRPVS
jgi:hypothetical protein